MTIERITNKVTKTEELNRYNYINSYNAHYGCIVSGYIESHII